MVGPSITQYAFAVRIGAAADHPAIAEHDHRAPRPAARETGRQVIKGHADLRGYFFLFSFLMYAPSRSFSYDTVFRKRLSLRYCRRSASFICSMTCWIAGTMSSKVRSS